MKIRQIFLIFFGLLIFVRFALPVKAEVIPYKITDGLTVQTTGYGNGQIFYQRFPQITYQGGKVMISAKPDGTGTMHVEDAMQVVDSYGYRSLIFKTYDNACRVFNREVPATDITSLFHTGYNNINVRFSEWCGPTTKTIGPVYIVYFKPDPGITPSPSPIPSPTATPTPTPIPAPSPFLELPWDYEFKNMSFNDSVLGIESYFDHTYPLLSKGGALQEPLEYLDQITTYNNEISTEKFYSKHDGYDYASSAKLHLGDAILAAASGRVTYFSPYGKNPVCISCGNMIVIDHGNTYQSRYLHLQDEGLVTNISGKEVAVTAGQPIGKVGSTGRSTGAHLHFGVFQDKNGDGDFMDNEPDGATDPLGWQSKNPDPWEKYQFEYNGKKRTGNKSYYLWKKKIDSIAGDLLPEGGVFTAGKFSVDFPSGIAANKLKTFIKAVPVAQPSASLRSLGTPYDVTVKDSAENPVTQFLKKFNITFDFSTLDLYPFKTETISIYSSQNGQNWTKENTEIDMVDQKAKTSVNHLTQFALMAERKDSTAPTTAALLDGSSGEKNWFRSDVIITLSAIDNPGGLGVEYTLYKIEGSDWQEYKEPLIFTEEGHYKVEFFSEDRDGNIETIKKVEFDIDKTLPEAEIQFDKEKLELTIIGKDEFEDLIVSQEELANKNDRVIVSDKAGNIITLVIAEKEKGKQAALGIESLQYNDDVLIPLEKNRFFVQYNLDVSKEDLKKLTQVFTLKDEIVFKLEYREKTNKTRIITSENGKEKMKEEINGLRFLKIYTENGELKHSY